MRSRVSTRPKRRAGGAGAGGARGARHDDSDDEGGVSLAAIKNKYKQGQKGKCYYRRNTREKETLSVPRGN